MTIVASRRPVLVTHSNCRALVPAARCKTDEAIRAMPSKGGVIGITMVRGFVRAGGPATIENVLDHIDHVVGLAGVEHVGVGTDVDFGRPGCSFRQEIRSRWNRLCQENFRPDGRTRSLQPSTGNIEMILGGNFQRALAEAWYACAFASVTN